MRPRFQLDPFVYLVLVAAGAVPSCGGSSEDTRSGELGATPGGAGADGSGIGGSGGTLPPPRLGVCDNPIASENGWVLCEQGFMHRPFQGVCETTLPRDPIPLSPDAGTPWGCTSDQECGHLMYGNCVPGAGCGGAAPYECVPGCVTDADCALQGAGGVCVCAGNVGRCAYTECSVDADCGEGYLCTAQSDCRGHFGTRCQTPDDVCADSNDCADGLFCSPTIGCSNCAAANVAGCGRPFLVDGVERLADTTFRSDWLRRRLAPANLDTLPAHVRAACADRWTRMARMEHASIAAFARFSLELMALGAPADLVRDATSAMADELRHAELCFALASAYSGQPVGPAPLPVDDCLAQPTLAAVAKTTLLEGCIGELVAAAEARELATHATDPTLRRALSEIADDESRHAALAWRFLRWAIDSGGAEIASMAREIVARGLASAAQSARAIAPQERCIESLEMALPTAAWQAALRHDVLERVVTPCLDALLGRAHASRGLACQQRA